MPMPASPLPSTRSGSAPNITSAEADTPALGTEAEIYSGPSISLGSWDLAALPLISDVTLDKLPTLLLPLKKNGQNKNIYTLLS